MTAEKNIRDELLRQNGSDAQKMQELREKILARDEARIARLKKLTIFTWGLVALGLVGALIVHMFLPEAGQPDVRSAIAYDYYSLIFISFLWAATMIAVVLSASLYLRSRALAMRQLHARLAGIEEQLKRIAEKE